MVKEELLGGLRNALERGEPIEKAIKSMINSGYNPSEVRAAANMMQTTGALSLARQKTMPIMSSSEKPEKSARPLPQATGKQSQDKKDKRKKIFFIILLIFVLLVLVGAIIFLIISPETIDKLIRSIFG